MQSSLRDVMRERAVMARSLLSAPSLLLILAVVLVPLVSILRLSVAEQGIGVRAEGWTLDNYTRLLESSYSRDVILNTLFLGFLVALAVVLLAVPIAYFAVRSRERVRGAIFIVIMLPLVAGGTVIAIGWVAVLARNGLLNMVLKAVGLPDGIGSLLGNPAAMVVVLVTMLMPIALVPMFSAVEGVNPQEEDAGRSLGRGELAMFLTVVVPQLLPAITTAFALVFILAINVYAAPVVIGGGRIAFLGPEIYDLIAADNNWPRASALAITTVVLGSLIALGVSWLGRRVYGKWR